MPNQFERSLSFVVLSLLLVTMSCDQIEGHVTLYVKPVRPPDYGQPCHCPQSTVCNSLDVYTAEEDVGDSNVTLIFLCGYHTLENMDTSTTEIGDIHYLNVRGDGSDADRVVIYGINLVFRNISEVHLDNITLQDTSFTVYPVNMESHVLFFVNNCRFIGSDCLIIGAEMTIHDGEIINGTNTALNLISSNLTLAGDVSFISNTGEKGGALSLITTMLNILPNTNVTFTGNNATSKGGAIFVDNPTDVFKVFPHNDCFYQLLEYDQDATYSLTFQNNSARNGGSHIFGAPLKGYCTAAKAKSVKIPSYEIVSLGSVFTFENPRLSNNSETSAITASPSRVCLCDDNGKPQCLDPGKIFVFNITHFPGELFSLSAVLVGADFGPTIGICHAHLLPVDTGGDSEQPHLEDNQRGQTLMRTECGRLNFTIYSKHNGVHVLTLTAVKSNLVRIRDNDKYQMEETYKDINTSIARYNNESVIEGDLIYTPLYLHVTLDQCPPGFSLSNKTLGCEIYEPLRQMYAEKLKYNLSYPCGYIAHPWYWIGKSENEEIILSRYCPSLLCNVSTYDHYIDVQEKSSIDAQCAFHRAGRFCGGCEGNYSLAIGSSHCIKCDNNNYLSLLIAFALAGLLLVFVIALLDLTVTQGIINSVVFYANIIWEYEDILFPQDSTGLLLFLRIFIAWLNLDLGIETCFVVGLDAFWKTLLQYLFPLYIWSIVGVIILIARHSSRLTKLLGSRAVSVLSSLILLSYMNLLRNAITSMSYAYLDYYSSTEKVRTLVVWLIDGRLEYLRSAKHIILFLIATVVLLLGLCYTTVLLFGQWLRTLSFFSRFHPIFDSYYAPIKPKHHYWLGMVLFTRVLLYLLKFILLPEPSTFALLIVVTLLFFYMSMVRPLQTTANFVFYSTFLVNLLIISGSLLFTEAKSTSEEAQEYKYVITILSTGVGFIQFCSLVITQSVRLLPLSWFQSCLHRFKYQSIDTDRSSPNYQDIDSTTSNPTVQESEVIITKTTKEYSSYRDSILEESSMSHVLSY